MKSIVIHEKTETVQDNSRWSRKLMNIFVSRDVGHVLDKQEDESSHKSRTTTNQSSCQYTRATGEAVMPKVLTTTMFSSANKM